MHPTERCQLCNGHTIKIDEHWYLCIECNQRSYFSKK